MFKIFLLVFFYSNLALSANFTLDKFKIEINSNFLGEEILLFGQKENLSELVIIFQGELKNARLYSKIKKGFFWTNQTKDLERIPSFFAVFSSPKKSLNELFLIPEITKKHFLVSNYSEELYKVRSALKNKGLYFEEELENVEKDLYLKKFKIPDNIPVGKIAITFYEISSNLFWIYVLSVCISTDLGGYIFGKIFKGPKLTKISPNKTYAGMIGGFFLSLITLFVFFYLDK